MEYKGFIIEGRYFLDRSKVNFKYTFDSSGYLFESDKESNRRSVRMEYYDGNGKIQDAIDLMLEIKDLEVPKSTVSIILDYWFVTLGKDVNEWYSKVPRKFESNLNYRISDINSLTDILMELSEKSSELRSFLTTEKIQEIYDNQYKKLKIEYAKQGNISRLGLYL